MSDFHDRFLQMQRDHHRAVAQAAENEAMQQRAVAVSSIAALAVKIHLDHWFLHLTMCMFAPADVLRELAATRDASGSPPA